MIGRVVTPGAGNAPAGRHTVFQLNHAGGSARPAGTRRGCVSITTTRASTAGKPFRTHTSSESGPAVSENHRNYSEVLWCMTCHTALTRADPSDGHTISEYLRTTDTGVLRQAERSFLVVSRIAILDKMCRESAMVSWLVPTLRKLGGLSLTAQWREHA